MRIKISSVQCPVCGAQEMHPTQDLVLVRGFKVTDDWGSYSQCLVCAGYYDKDLNYNADAGNPDEGWFGTPH